jgi:hypothetical protein
MATDIDERLLRSVWSRENLGNYEGRWIAFRDGVIGSNESLPNLAEPYLKDIREGDGPLFAFVSFQVRA